MEDISITEEHSEQFVVYTLKDNYQN